jgi:hypothetical protein
MLDKQVHVMKTSLKIRRKKKVKLIFNNFENQLTIIASTSTTTILSTISRTSNISRSMTRIIISSNESIYITMYGIHCANN